MLRTVAGIFEPGGIGDVDRAERALAAGVPDRADGVLRLGALWLSFTGPLGLRTGSRVCIADADLLPADPDRVEREVDPEGAILRTHGGPGSEGLADLRGGFAAVVWDEAAQTGLICRDHFGTRPMFMAREGRWLLFASEVRNLLPMLRRRPAPDRLAVVSWIARGSVPLGRTMFASVKQLRPAHLCELGMSPDPIQRPFWRPRFVPTASRSADDVDAAIRRELDAAIARRIPKAANLGVLIGGGIDAATVAASVRRMQPARSLRGFSAVFPDHPTVDESQVVERISQALSLPVTRLAVGEGSLLAGALAFQREWSLPLLSANHAFMEPLVRRAGADGVDVLLDGEGGDELFGLSPPLLADRLRRGRVIAAVKLAGRFPGAGDRPPLRQALRVVRFYGVANALPPRLAQLLVRRGMAPSGGVEVLTPSDRRAVEDAFDDRVWTRWPGPRWWSWLAWLQTDSRELIGGQDYFRRRAAGTGVTPRHPLLDDVDLIQTVLELPPEAAFDPYLNRPVARRATAGVLPDDVRLRRGKIFWNEIFDACMVHDRTAIGRLLSGPAAEVRAYVAPTAVEDVLEGGPSVGYGWAYALWRLATAELWLRGEAHGGTTPAPEFLLPLGRAPARRWYAP